MTRNGTKLPLMTFVGDRLADLRFVAGAGVQTQEGNFRTHILRFLESSPDPGIKRYTEKVGMHNVIEMSRFLSLLGAQTIQLTARNNGAPLTSWIFQTTRNRVEYVQVISGKIDESTINFELDLADLLVDEGGSSKMNRFGILVRLLASNKGIKKQLNLSRLVIAAGIEFITYLGTRNNGKRD
jgi:hypothetical protein